jgi:hypothetical protein
MSGLPNIQSIWSISEHNFNEIALQLFQFQAKYNAVYAQYLKLIDKDPDSIKDYRDIPFLPISFFKTHKVVSVSFNSEAIFQSSSTTGTYTAKHNVKSLSSYHQNCVRIIEDQIGSVSDYEILGLLPNYLERQNSSLVSMVKYLMDSNTQEDSFYLYNHDALIQKIEQSTKPILLFGVSFALLDFADRYASNKPFTIIETGGMKGRKIEITKAEVYSTLQASFPQATIRSEYGMTELLSQAYSDASARYTCPPWMKVLARADNDPLSNKANGRTAALNIIDLANLHSCAFIAADDLGQVFPDGSFEVTGRMDHSDVRGCSLMVI